MILEMHQLFQHFAASEQIMKVLLGILVKTFVAPNERIGGSGSVCCAARSKPFDLASGQEEPKRKDSRRRRYFAILHAQQKVVCMRTEF